MNRIKRLLGYPQKHSYMREKLFVILLVMSVAAVFAGSTFTYDKINIPFLGQKEMKIENDRNIELPELSTTSMDTIPRSQHKKNGTSNFIFNNNGEHKSIEIQQEDGKIRKDSINFSKISD